MYKSGYQGEIGVVDINWGSCQIRGGICSQKTELPASDNHRVACIRLILVLIIIINSGGMGEWPTTDRCWRRFNPLEEGAALGDIHVYTGFSFSPLRVLSGPCNTQ